MADEPDHETLGLSRRELLKRVGAVGAAAAVPASLLAPAVRAAAEGTQGAGAAQTAGATRAAEALETLSAAEAETLEAIVARLIPTDAAGPGAAEARAAHYIDRALSGALSSSREAYRTGLAAMNRYSQATRGQAFVRLSSGDQDAVLGEMEKNAADGFAPDSATFFNLLLAHTIQGTFCDPYYGGNAGFVGWDLLGYPGVRLAVAAEQQRSDARLSPERRSAYDLTMFSKKKPARASLGAGDGHHGD